MIPTEELEEAREDLEAMLAEVLASVFGEEALPTGAPPAAGACAVAHLAVLDESDGSTLAVRLRCGASLARVLARRMFGPGATGELDVLDAVGELGNIAAGNVKALLFLSARLSLPAPELVQDPAPDDGPDAPAVRVAAVVLDEVVELTLLPGSLPDGLTWPPTLHDEVLETQP
jgi:hypothetical protein